LDCWHFASIRASYKQTGVAGVVGSAVSKTTKSLVLRGRGTSELVHESQNSGKERESLPVFLARRRNIGCRGGGYLSLVGWGDPHNAEEKQKRTGVAVVQDNKEYNKKQGGRRKNRGVEKCFLRRNSGGRWVVRNIPRKKKLGQSSNCGFFLRLLAEGTLFGKVKEGYRGIAYLD